MKYATKLIEKHDAGVDVRVIVDGKVSGRDAYDKSVQFLIGHGIPVMRWRHPSYPFHGMHRKFMIVDGVDVVTRTGNDHG